MRFVDWVNGVYGAGALLSAGAAGWCLWRCGCVWQRRARHRAAVRPDGSQSLRREGRRKAESVDERIVAYAAYLSQRMDSPLAVPWTPAFLRDRPSTQSAATAGMAGRLTDGGCWEARVRLAVGGLLAGLLAGGAISVELGCCLAATGALTGWQALPWALRHRARCRAEAMERDLSEMLDVVALGMRSGMSFDRSLELYTGHFSTVLADALADAHRQWSCGLASRDEALRAVAASYDSPLFERVVENVVRSLRFGATLADNLEDAAREARSGYKARKQEQVAKAPVKMMVPTGVLILPAMLILVLGPVLLELAGGF